MPLRVNSVNLRDELEEVKSFVRSTCPFVRLQFVGARSPKEVGRQE